MSKTKIGILITVLVVLVIIFVGIRQSTIETPLSFSGFVSFGETGMTNSTSEVTTAASGTAVVAANNGRIYLHVVNTGPNDVYLIFDTLNQTSESMATGTGMLLATDQHYEIGPDNLYQGGITGRSDTATSTLTIIEK